MFDKLRRPAQCQRIAFDCVGSVSQVNVIGLLQAEQRRLRNRAQRIEPGFLRGNSGQKLIHGPTDTTGQGVPSACQIRLRGRQ